LLEDHILVEMSAHLRPQLIVARDEHDRELGFLGDGRGSARRGVIARGVILSVCALHRYLRYSPTTPLCCIAVFDPLRPRTLVAACKILMQMGFSRDGLDHILDAATHQTTVGGEAKTMKVRTTSHM
jgi:hypothetical protein